MKHLRLTLTRMLNDFVCWLKQWNTYRSITIFTYAISMLIIYGALDAVSAGKGEILLRTFAAAVVLAIFYEMRSSLFETKLRDARKQKTNEISEQDERKLKSIAPNMTNKALLNEQDKIHLKKSIKDAIAKCDYKDQLISHQQYEKSVIKLTVREYIK